MSDQSFHNDVSVYAGDDGKITISVPDTMTTGLAPGHYTDALRVHDGEGKRSTLWSGHILVSADLFA